MVGKMEPTIKKLYNQSLEIIIAEDVTGMLHRARQGDYTILLQDSAEASYILQDHTLPMIQDDKHQYISTGNALYQDMHYGMINQLEN